VVLLLVISAAWLVAMYLGLAMCRLAARSDRSHAAELAELLASSSRGEQAPASSKEPTRPARQPGEFPYRATG
jgi:hypothetical protein